MKQLIVCLVLAIAFGFIACNKGGSSGAVVTPPLILSSAKSISAVIFKAIENPGLAADVTSIFSTDTIKAQFPYGVSLNGLKPTFSFSGKAINPVNNAAQNFTNPITYTVTAEDGSVMNYVLACRVERLLDTATLILGKWKVLRDSLSNIGNFYYMEGGAPHIPTPGVYYGTASDYYDFNINDTVYIVENLGIAKSTYQILPNGKLFITGLSVYPPADIETLTTSNATFFWASTSPNGGQYARRLYLIK